MSASRALGPPPALTAHGCREIVQGLLVLGAVVAVHGGLQSPPTGPWQRSLLGDSDKSQARKLPDFLPSVPNLTRWEAGTLPLFHRNMGLHWHDMCAESLGMPKVALMFLSRGPIHQEVTWERWLQQAEGLVMLPGTERGAYDFTLQQQLEALHACKMERSIHRVTAKKQHMFRLYVHPADPEFLGFHEGSIFYDAMVRNLLPAGSYYYSYELVEGVRSLLAAALEDRLNQRFVILCEACVPLYPPALIYMQLMHEAKSRVIVHPVLDTETEYSPDWNEKLQTEHGVNRLQHWRKGNQRNTLVRRHAELAVKDTQLVQAFVHACKQCTVEERFFATLMALNGQLDDVYTHSSLAYEDWSRQTWGGHPHDWQADEVNITLLFKARTDKGCSGSWTSESLHQAEQLLTSYLGPTDLWRLAQPPPPQFTPLQPECLLMARKFKPWTTANIVNIFSDPVFQKWNYTQQYG